MGVLMAAVKTPTTPAGGGTVSAKPDLSALPGSNVVQKLLDGILAWGLVAALIGLVLGAAMWTFASHAHNPHYATRGRAGTLIAGAAALVIGAAPAIVNFFHQLGTQAK